MTKKKAGSVGVVGDTLDEKPPEEKLNFEDQAMEDASRDFADSEQMIQLHRYDPTIGGRPRLLGGLSPAEFNGLYVMERFGGGRYFGRWKKKDGTYKRYYFDIEGPSKVPTFHEAKEAKAEAESPYRFLSTRQDEGEPTQTGVAGISVVDILRIIGETRREAREEMKTMIELLRPATPPQDATDKVFSMVEKLMPMIQSADGGGGPLSVLLQFKEPIAELVGGISSALKNYATGKTPGSPAVTTETEGKRLAPLPRPEPPLVPKEPEPEPKDEETMLIESFKPYMGMLTRAASIGGDPEDYCNMILDQVPPMFYDRLRAWLTKPGCLDDLGKLDQSVYTQQAWWESLRGLLLESLNEALGHGVRAVQPEPNPDPPGGGPAPRHPAA